MEKKVRIHDLEKQLACLAEVEFRLSSPTNFTPFGDSDRFAPFVESREHGIPTTLGELGESLARSYDLTVTAASEAQIPVAGSVGGAFNRRVIVLERCAFKRIDLEDREQQFGWAIRLCVTVSRWEATTKISLPFLAASAQLGTIEAQWTFQVVGLAGKLLDEMMVGVCARRISVSVRLTKLYLMLFATFTRTLQDLLMKMVLPIMT